MVGRLTGVHGIRGELRCRPSVAGDLPRPGEVLTIGSGPDALAVRCTSVRRHHERLLIGFDGVSTPEAARALVGRDIVAEREPEPLGPGEYFDRDLIGLRLLDEGGRELGRVARIEHYPAQDCLVVEPGGALVPLVRAFVRTIDLDARTLVVSLPAGLLEPDA